MHKLTRRSVSAILRHGGARYRNTTAPFFCSSLPSETVRDRDANLRWYSVLTTMKHNAINSSTQLNLKSGLYFGNRYESTATASDASASPPAERFEYQAEVSRLMDLIVNSLYSNKEVFLRELISNASDALDKLRFLSVTEPGLLKDAVDLDIRIQTDKDNGIVTITDSGIGMTQQDLVDCLGTIAQSGTAKFLKALKDSKDAGGENNLIGQFGVGFYSSFLVADKVIVSTKSPKSDKQYVWEGEANASSYTIREETDPKKLIPRGSRITLYLKHDDKGFAHPERIQRLVKNYSQFVSFPIYTWQEKGYTKEVEVDEDPAEAKKDEQGDKIEKKKKTKTVVERYWDWELSNETQPIWLRTPKDVTTEEYNEFYKITFNEYLDPLASSHFTTEGEVEFRSILYVPSIAPTGNNDIVNPKTKNIRLYVKRVFISDDFDGELFPRYLSFVKGVVDSSDLPLNVSREILQESRIVRIMRKRLVRKAFDLILGISMSENKDDYDKFWENFGKYFKMGCMEDRENHKRIAPLLRFFSSQSEEEMISLDEYVENMKPDQKDIYYIAADSMTSAKNTPFLERLLEKDLEVLLLVDPIDEVAIQNLKSYKEKNFVDISKEDLDLGDKNEEKEKEMKQEFGQTCDWIKKRLGDKVASVQISNRLSSSPCVLVSGKFGWSANMERLMKSQTVSDTSSLEFMRSRRVFEINPNNPIIQNLNAACKSNPDDEDAIRAIDLLYDAALVSSGFTPDNPAQLGGKIYEMMGIALSGKWSSPAAAQQEAVHPLNPRGLSLTEINDIKVTSSMCLYLDWNSSATSMTVGLSNGSVSIVSLVDSGLQVQEEWKAHDFELWTTIFDTHQPHFVYTGSDDCKLICWDLRGGSSKSVFQNSKAHKMGVCSIVKSPFDPNTLITGSYDEHLRVWDVRSISRPVNETSTCLGGGVWRIKYHHSVHGLVLAACMHNGFAIVNIKENGAEVTETYNEHESLAYGADWHREESAFAGKRKTMVATCSFYDKLLRIWMPESDIFS